MKLLIYSNYIPLTGIEALTKENIKGSLCTLPRFIMFSSVLVKTFTSEEMTMARLTGPQIAAAMALAQMTQDQLAKAAGLGRNTLNRTINDTASTKDDT